MKKLLAAFLALCLVLTLLPATVWAEGEQFTLPTGKTYYFDLSSEKDNIGTINAGYTGAYTYPGLPDTTLHYVPFTYAGTVNAYSLNSEMATTEDYANANKCDRSLFISEYNVSHTTSWNDLNTKNLIFGKVFDTNYNLRTLSGGSHTANVNTDIGGVPNTNEWDCISLKGSIKNWSNIYSWVQDTCTGNVSFRTVRGATGVADWNDYYASTYGANLGFRPALEVLNHATLTADGLKAVTLNRNGGRFNSSTDNIQIVCTGDTFKAPNNEGLTPPSENTGTYFKWNTQADGKGTDYSVGETVEFTDLTTGTLYAQWNTGIPAVAASIASTAPTKLTEAATNDGSLTSE